MPLVAGDRIGDWIIDAPLGEGGMGTVFRCHSAMSGRIAAAVKVIKPDAIATARERFVREVEALTRLKHPGIVAVHGFGEAEGGLLWLAMELVEGEDLEARIRRGPMPVDEARRVFAPIAEALAFAHAQGVFHRDIKPANVRIDGAGAGRLLDFGLVLTTGTERLTGGGMVMGTPAYLPPEVFDGAMAEPVLGDVYALGVVLHEALTGKLAFLDDAAAPGGLARLVGAKLDAGALDPGEGVDPALRDAVRHATAPAPGERAPSVDDLVAALTGRAKALPPPPVGDDEPVTFGERHRYGVIGGLGAAGCLAVAAVVAVVALGVAVFALS